jgi:hypothetical protein
MGDAVSLILSCLRRPGLFSNTVDVLLSELTESFSFAKASLGYWRQYSGLLENVGDFNGDGKPDIVVANPAPGFDCTMAYWRAKGMARALFNRRLFSVPEIRRGRRRRFQW